MASSCSLRVHSGSPQPQSILDIVIKVVSDLVTEVSRKERKQKQDTDKIKIKLVSATSDKENTFSI